jgi:hypothetical protein
MVTNASGMAATTIRVIDSLPSGPNVVALLRHLERGGWMIGVPTKVFGACKGGRTAYSLVSAPHDGHRRVASSAPHDRQVLGAGIVLVVSGRRLADPRRDVPVAAEIGIVRAGTMMRRPAVAASGRERRPSS